MELDQNQLAQIENSVSIEQIQLSEKLGAIKATNFIKKLVTVTEIKLLADVKQSKQYKGLKVVDDNGKVVTVTTWAEFCQQLGMSCEKVDQDLLNLSTFGEDFLETSQRMGLGYRDLRKLRKLDEADRAVIINGESVKAEDRESLIDLIEEMSAKHAKEKGELNKKVEDLTADIEAKNLVIKSKSENNDKLLHENTKLNSPIEIAKRAETLPQQVSLKALETVNTACHLMHNNTIRFVNEINSVYDALNEHNIFDVQENITLSIIAAFQQIAQTASDLCIQIDFEEMVNPVWLSSQNDNNEMEQ
ncbi:hypothetical protein [Acinetobacter bereziniae]|uniref:hypothetical protein n=1 Tax=Acinetobacter bereziniae TaxID=106648 RepID=UPI000EF6D2B2|nr:hypothetical protein [Acinetobacter bereziniae]